MTTAVDSQPLIETACKLTAEAEMQFRIVQEAFGEIDGFRHELQVRFQELQSWQTRLEQREIELDKRLDHLTNKIELLTSAAKTGTGSRVE